MHKYTRSMYMYIYICANLDQLAAERTDSGH